MSIEEIKTCLQSFSCEVLTNSACEKSDIQDFVCDIRNSTLADYLHDEAEDDSENGVNKVYLIRDINGKIAAFFSLRCGAALELCSLDEEYETLLDTEKEYVRELTKARRENNDNYFYALVEAGKKTFSTKIGEFVKIAERNEKIESDKIRTGNSDGAILYVEDCHPAIELQYFCRNTAYTNVNLPKGKIGFGLFWEVIVPKIVAISKEIGAEYLYLFAADKSDDEDDKKLISYYRDALTFNACDFEGVALPRPKDDSECSGLVQPIGSLETMRKRAWEEHEDFFEEEHKVN